MGSTYDPITQGFVDIGNSLLGMSSISENSVFILFIMIFIVSAIVVMNVPFPGIKYVGVVTLLFFAIMLILFSFQIQLTTDFRIFNYTVEGVVNISVVLELIAIIFLIIFIIIKILSAFVKFGSNYWLIIVSWVLIIIVQFCRLNTPAIIFSIIIIAILYTILLIVKKIMIGDL